MNIQVECIFLASGFLEAHEKVVGVATREEILLSFLF